MARGAQTYHKVNVGHRRAVTQQQPDDVHVAGPRGQVQRRRTLDVDDVG